MEQSKQSQADDHQRQEAPQGRLAIQLPATLRRLNRFQQSTASVTSKSEASISCCLSAFIVLSIRQISAGLIQPVWPVSV